MDNLVLGVDIGGSHITASAVNLETHSVIADSVFRNSINSKGRKDEIIELWTEVILKSKQSVSGISHKIGISMPGPCDYNNGICYIRGLDKFESLYNLNIKELIAEKLEIDERDIKMMNDATCFLKGELFGGAVQQLDNVIGITLGTGLGSCTYINEKISDGDLYSWSCKEGSAEDYLSSRWFINQYEQITGVKIKNVKDLSDRLPEDGVAKELFIEFGNTLGKVLAKYVKRHDAKTVVIGGNINKAWDLFIPETEAVLKSHFMNIKLTKSTLGEYAALLGAASLFKR